MLRRGFLRGVRVEGLSQPQVVPGFARVIGEGQGDDLRRRHLLINPLVGAVIQVVQVWHQGHAVAAQALAGIALGSVVDLVVYAVALWIEGQERLFVQEFFQVDIGFFADQFEVEAIGLTDAFGAGEREDLQVAGEVFEGETEVGLVGSVEHDGLPVGWSSAVINKLRLVYGAHSWEAVAHEKH